MQPKINIVVSIKGLVAPTNLAAKLIHTRIESRLKETGAFAESGTYAHAETIHASFWVSNEALGLATINVELFEFCIQDNSEIGVFDSDLQAYRRVISSTTPNALVAMPFTPANFKPTLSLEAATVETSARSATETKALHRRVGSIALGIAACLVAFGYLLCLAPKIAIGVLLSSAAIVAFPYIVRPLKERFRHKSLASIWSKEIPT